MQSSSAMLHPALTQLSPILATQNLIIETSIFPKQQWFFTTRINKFFKSIGLNSKLVMGLKLPSFWSNKTHASRNSRKKNNISFYVI